MIGKRIAVFALCLGLFGSITFVTGENANAKIAPATVISTKNIKNEKVHLKQKARNDPAKFYKTTALTKYNYEASQFGHITFTRTTSVYLKRNGKKYTYDYVVSSDGFLHGWIRSDYLVKGKDKFDWDKKSAYSSAKKLPADIKLKKGSIKMSDDVSDRNFQSDRAIMTNGHKIYWSCNHPSKALEFMPKLYKISDTFVNNTKHWQAYYIVDDRYYSDENYQFKKSGFRSTGQDWLEGGCPFPSIINPGRLGDDKTLISYSKKIILLSQNAAIDSWWGSGTFSPISHSAK